MANQPPPYSDTDKMATDYNDISYQFDPPNPHTDTDVKQPTSIYTSSTSKTTSSYPYKPAHQLSPPYTATVQPLPVDSNVSESLPVFRYTPVFTTCPSCQFEIVTTLHYEVGSLSFLMCCLSATAGCFLGCCLAPFFIDGCKDVVHTCPRCLHVIATWKRM